jgi:hypothetical protein
VTGFHSVILSLRQLSNKLIYPDSVSLVNPPTTTIPNTSPAVPRSQYPTDRGGTISTISQGAALEKYFELRRRGRVDDHFTRHWREGREGRGFRIGRLKWKKDVGFGEGRNALSRGRIMSDRNQRRSFRVEITSRSQRRTSPFTQHHGPPEYLIRNTGPANCAFLQELAPEL